MKSFFVGQRVRIVSARSEHGRRVVGMEAIVSETGCKLKYSSRCDIAVMVSGRDEYGFESYELEPITDPGHEVTTWDKCEWKPEHLREVPA